MALSILGDGIQYYLIEVGFWDDDKIVSMEKKLGEVYCARLMKLMDRIYSNGYFLKWDPVTKKTFCDSKGYNQEDIQLMVDYLCEVDFIDEGIYRTYNIITSKTIQKIYLHANPRKKGMKLIWEYCALDKESYESNKVRTITLQSLLKKDLDFNDLPERYRKEKSEPRENILDRLDAILNTDIEPDRTIGDKQPESPEQLTYCFDDAFEFSCRDFKKQNQMFKDQVQTEKWLESYKKVFLWIDEKFKNLKVSNFQLTYAEYRMLFKDEKFSEDQMLKTLEKLSTAGVNNNSMMYYKIKQYMGYIKNPDSRSSQNTQQAQSKNQSSIPLITGSPRANDFKKIQDQQNQSPAA